MRSADFPMFWRATGLKNLTDSCDPDNTMEMNTAHDYKKTLKKKAVL